MNKEKMMKTAKIFDRILKIMEYFMFIAAGVMVVSAVLLLFPRNRAGISRSPTAAIANPMIRYSVRYSRSKAQIAGVSSSAIGLYILNTIALPTPSSARFKNIRSDLNKPFRPRYCVPR